MRSACAMKSQACAHIQSFGSACRDVGAGRVSLAGHIPTMRSDSAVSSSFQPPRHGVEEACANARIAAGDPRRNVKRMVGVREKLQGRSLAEPLDQRLQELQLREVVARALKE